MESYNLFNYSFINYLKNSNIEIAQEKSQKNGDSQMDKDKDEIKYFIDEEGFSFKKKSIY